MAMTYSALLIADIWVHLLTSSRAKMENVMPVI